MIIHILVFNGKFHLEVELSLLYITIFLLISFILILLFPIVVVPIQKIFFILDIFSFLSDDYTLHGPIFIQEPSHVMFPLDSEEKKVKLNCEVKGNPKPHIRFVGLKACVSMYIVSIIKINQYLWSTAYVKSF